MIALIGRSIRIAKRIASMSLALLLKLIVLFEQGLFFCLTKLELAPDGINAKLTIDDLVLIECVPRMSTGNIRIDDGLSGWILFDVLLSDSLLVGFLDLLSLGCGLNRLSENHLVLGDLIGGDFLLLLQLLFGLAFIGPGLLLVDNLFVKPLAV